MNLIIGIKIKELRREHGMTQEQLAELVGVSFQAVSKWENQLALPDITLVPRLAQIFSVTIDELFSYHVQEIQTEIEQVVTESAAYRESDPAKGRDILEEDLKKYPENDILLNNLLYVMDYSSNPDETIKVATRLIDRTSMSDVKYDALRFLAYAYNAKGDPDSALAALEQIPELYFTKLSEMAFVLTGQPKMDAATKQKWISFETLLQMIAKVAECYEAEGKPKEAIREIELAQKLLQAFEGEDRIDRYGAYVDYLGKELLRLQEG